jgi:vacuolar-type H+-ATPase subunit F/Vma7
LVIGARSCAVGIAIIGARDCAIGSAIVGARDCAIGSAIVGARDCAIGVAIVGARDCAIGVAIVGARDCAIGVAIVGTIVGTGRGVGYAGWAVNGNNDWSSASVSVRGSLIGGVSSRTISYRDCPITVTRAIISST